MVNQQMADKAAWELLNSGYEWGATQKGGPAHWAKIDMLLSEDGMQLLGYRAQQLCRATPVEDTKYLLGLSHRRCPRCRRELRRRYKELVEQYGPFMSPSVQRKLNNWFLTNIRVRRGQPLVNSAWRYTVDDTRCLFQIVGPPIDLRERGFREDTIFVNELGWASPTHSYSPEKFKEVFEPAEHTW